MEKFLKYVIRILNYVYLFNMNMRSNDFTKSELVKPVLIFKGYRYFLNIIVFKKKSMETTLYELHASVALSYTNKER